METRVACLYYDIQYHSTIQKCFSDLSCALYKQYIDFFMAGGTKLFAEAGWRRTVIMIRTYEVGTRK